ncbi:methionine adenosyltransferase [Candidatus Acetothermia bacterium]|jgi:S-adenosylmethionine synthetase|nr:methionine adenosyltransferase [Candidatus Acetothermia bacterium]MCI2431055.1 methionine adenosyltransferase [Candidatus Acetothermia bacterium]MCI2436951.1 methionine adenosyltransferase [Candidatus Acetothermia bacterium]
MSIYLFTSESVAEGHPDKLCDQISDAILDEILKQDPQARVACETFATNGLVFIAGEITSTARVDCNKIARQTIKEIGYDQSEYGFDHEHCAVLVSIHEQSPDIADAVGKKQASDKYESLGAGDQGIMYGYACNETHELMPLPIMLAHKLVQRLAQMRREKKLVYLYPDGKSQVTVAYDEKGHPVRAHTVVLSAQHSPYVERSQLERDLIEHIVKPVLGRWLDKETQILINPSGRFVIGGPCGDTGMTGRKIEVDTYGGYGSHGGGAFSGKDPTKVDRSASYYARYIAKNIVAAGLATECEVQVAYAIGKPRPLAVTVDTFDTGKVPNGELTKLIQEHFDFRPAAIIEELDLRRPIYRPLAAYGHFGRPELNLPWEETDRAEALRRASGR